MSIDAYKKRIKTADSEGNRFTGLPYRSGKPTKSLTKYLIKTPSAEIPPNYILDYNKGLVPREKIKFRKDGNLRATMTNKGNKNLIQNIDPLYRQTYLSTFSINRIVPVSKTDRNLRLTITPDTTRGDFNNWLKQHATILRKPFTEVIGYIYNAETGKREVFAFLSGDIITAGGNITYEGRLLFHYKNDSDNDEITEFINTNRPFPYYEIRQYSPANRKLLNQIYAENEKHICLFEPILKWCEEKPENKNRKSIYRKLKGIKSSQLKNPINYLEKYSKGIPRSKIQELCDHLGITIVIYPFIQMAVPSKPVYEFKPKGKSYKNFEYINSTLNHLDVKKDNTKCIKKVSAEKMQEIVENRKDVLYYKNKNDVPSKVVTPTCTYVLKNDQTEIEERFLDDNPVIKNNNFSNTLIGNEWNDSTENSNPIWDFVNASFHSPDSIDFIERNVIINGTINHIDQRKAHASFKTNPFYDGICVNPSMTIQYPTKTFAFQHAGFYKIHKIAMKNSPNYKTLYKMNFLRNFGIYPHVFLKFLTEQQIDYEILEGVYGEKIDFDFTDEMKNKKFKNGVEDENGIATYVSFVGKSCMVSDEVKFYMKGDIKYLNSCAEELENINHRHKMRIDYERGTAVVYAKKNTQSNRMPLASYINCYTALSTLLQVIEIPYERIVKVVVDGIYYTGEQPRLIASFRNEPKKITKNEGSGYFFSYRREREEECIETPDYDESKVLEIKNNMLIKGAGGCGKTTRLLNDPRLCNVVFSANSNELCKSVDIPSFPHQHFSKQHRHLLNNKFKSASVVIVDEVSTLNLQETKNIMDMCAGKLVIFIGDIGYQTPPIEKKGYTYERHLNMFKHQIELTKNYRFIDLDHNKTCYEVRKMMKDGLKCDKILEYIKTRYLVVSKVDNLKRDDTFICAKKVFMKKYENQLKEDFNVMKTIHSVQGKTIQPPNKLFINLEGAWDETIIYTAISRAKTTAQIVIVTNS